jgi:hypothetical protein
MTMNYARRLFNVLRYWRAGQSTQFRIKIFSALNTVCGAAHDMTFNAERVLPEEFLPCSTPYRTIAPCGWAYITEIKNRRLLVIDEQKGLAVGFSNFYHDSKLKVAKLKGVPGMESLPSYQGVFNMPAIHFFKIKKGKIYDIEATGLVEPYGAKTGWK